MPEPSLVKKLIGESKMRIAELFKCRSIIYATAGIVLALLLNSPTQLHAQAGYNAACTSATAPTNAACSLTTLDASLLAGSTICQKIYSALSVLNTLIPGHTNPGGVIDARSITSGLTCSAANETPWTSGTSVITTPAIILLPAGEITISTGWIIPDRTRVFGEGERSNPASPYAPGTQIVAASGLTGTMISLGGANLYPNSTTVYPCGVYPGTSDGVCFGVSISDVMLEGNSDTTLVGIANTNSQELSYVNHVNLYGILGTGLSITTTQAQNSGPYSNIVCNPASSYASGASVCVDINGVGDTRGIHGLTATAPSTGSTGPTAAVLLDSNNNTIEDAHFEGFQNGILVGANAGARSNVLFNITGGTGAGPMTNVVEISSANTVTTLSIMGVSSGGATNSIEDEDYGSSPLLISDSYVGLYVVGDQISSSVYSRFNTSKQAPSWLSGAVSVSGSCSTVANGTLYSNSSGAAGSTLYVCLAGTWKIIE
jgi:hypothetical protein